MFTLYPQIANRLRSLVPALRTIDYDFGQLANPEQAMPIDYPACLISVESVKWTENGQKIQKGALVVAVTVAIRPTFVSAGQSSPDLWRYTAMMQPVNDVFTALAGYKGGEIIAGIDENEQEVEVQGTPFTGLVRTATQRMKRYDNIQAHTHLFTCVLTDNTATRTLVPHPTPPEIRAYLPTTLAVFPEVLT